MEIVAKENKVTIVDHEKGHCTEELVDDPLMIPRRICETWKPQLIDDLPDAFAGMVTLLHCSMWHSECCFPCFKFCFT